MVPTYQRALIVGAGEGLSASLARRLSHEGLRLGLASRSIGKLEGLAAETGAALHSCDAVDPSEVEALFARMEPALGGPPDVVIYNASGRLRGAIADLDPDAVRHALMVSAYGGFLVAQAAARRMLPGRHGAILFTGASASVKGYAESAAFAMGKFALRGLSQSLARELQPKGIHVAHFVIDGGIRSASRPETADAPDSLLDPDAIASAYWDVLRQDRSAWTSEIALRPWVERF
ncbi:SDR family NAD(P)-dependent oxidoreductase [Methylobacterium sp. W2]|uniref:SDR family NAD(P)-dependent oxidoreductase n=1 Tax=Methylobacterium sp. W2 TaxID=2598107 RepID=UPI001D0C0722|nr:SDR family NAD(P)-dependent oxidoreductase [Methylobacterium sp. W2]MCC0806786.1 SDR family NAD(P)-dependent oxidoreductase [Methylobacterium sp. W2]